MITTCCIFHCERALFLCQYMVDQMYKMVHLITKTERIEVYILCMLLFGCCCVCLFVCLFVFFLISIFLIIGSIMMLLD